MNDEYSDDEDKEDEVEGVDTFEYWKEMVEWKRENDSNHVFAFLLYSRANENLLNFIKKYQLELRDLTGPNFTIFVIWSLLLDNPTMMEFMYDEIKPYELAREFDIEAKKIPCLMFFRTYDDTDVLIYTLKDDWTRKDLLEEFEKITDDVSAAIKDATKKESFDEQVMRKTLYKRIRKREWIRSAIVKVKEARSVIQLAKDFFDLFS